MKGLFKKLLSERGFTMTEIVVAGGITAAAALGVAGMLGQLGGTNKDADAVIERTQFSSALVVYLNSGLGCNELKNAPTSGNGTFGTDTPLRLTNWRWGGFLLFESGTQLRMTKINSITATLNVSPTPQLVNVNGIPLTKTFLRIKTVLETKSRTFPHTYDLPVLVDGANKLRYCGGTDQDLAETCAALGGVIDPVTKLCKFQGSCSAYGSYQTLNCYPLVNGKTCEQMNLEGAEGGGMSPYPAAASVINPLTSDLSCPGGSAAVSTGADTWTLKVSCGKKCEADVSYSLGYYTCLKCI